MASKTNLLIVDAQTGQRLFDFGAGSAGLGSSVAVSPDGLYLAAAGVKGLKIWAIACVKTNESSSGFQARLVRAGPSDLNSSAGFPPHGLLFAPDSKSLAFCTSKDYRGNSTVFWWEFNRSEEPRPISLDYALSAEPFSITPDGRQLLLPEENGEIATYNAPAGIRVSAFREEPRTGPRMGPSWVELRLSPDGSKLALSSASDLGVNIYDPRTGRLLYSLPEADGIVSYLAWSADSRRLAVARENGNIAIWDLEIVGQILAQLGLNP
jgi:WD40 repeat protein